MAVISSVVDRAIVAGYEAAAKCVPHPMVVREADVLSGAPLPGGKSYYVPEGVCGFAWVNVSPGNCALANYLKKHYRARKSYSGGVDYWVGDFGQCMEKKEAFASAMAGVLRDAGFNAYAESRMD